MAAKVRNLFEIQSANACFVFFILYEMGMDDKAVRRIMGITQEAIRSTRYRIMQNGRK
ncbi:MAG: hypothetical protein J5965_23780 [Aeriscardovia sp.]|nr:hypothetical protein [Aeriscardovia sp.]